MIYKDLISRMVQIAWDTHNVHLPSALSALPIIESIYQHFNFEKDVFILSKGHAAMALYAVLEKRGRRPNITCSQITRDIENGIYCSTGSLGHGLPIAAGVALAKKIRKQEGVVHVLLGDGECLEGTFWETMNLVQEFHLDNLRVEIDANGQQACKSMPPLLRQNLMMFESLAFYCYPKGYGIPYLQERPWMHSFRMTNEDHARILQDLE